MQVSLSAFKLCGLFTILEQIQHYQVYEVADNVRNLCQILDNDVAPAVQIIWHFPII